MIQSQPQLKSVVGKICIYENPLPINENWLLNTALKG